MSYRANSKAEHSLCVINVIVSCVRLSVVSAKLSSLPFGSSNTENGMANMAASCVTNNLNIFETTTTTTTKQKHGARVARV